MPMLVVFTIPARRRKTTATLCRRFVGVLTSILVVTAAVQGIRHPGPIVVKTSAAAAAAAGQESSVRVPDVGDFLGSSSTLISASSQTPSSFVEETFEHKEEEQDTIEEEAAAAAAAAVASNETAAAPLLLRAARGEKVERIPVWMMRQAGRHMQAYRDLCLEHPTFRERSETPSLSKAISLQPYYRYGVDGVILFSDILTPLPAMGIQFDIAEGGNITIDTPIRTRHDFDSLLQRWNEEDESVFPAFVGQVLQELRQEVKNTATVIGFIGLPFTVASYVIEGQTGTTTGFPQIQHLIEHDPALFHDILAVVAHNLALYACYQIKHGAQLIQVFDSWAGYLPDAQYQEFVFPYQQQVIATIKQHSPTTPIIIYMAPGPYSRKGRRLPQLGRTGADIVSIDHTVDLITARSLLPASVGVQGNLDPSLLRAGPGETIRRATEHLLASHYQHQEQQATATAPFIMNLGHGIDKETPEAHAAVFVNTVQNYHNNK